MRWCVDHEFVEVVYGGVCEVVADDGLHVRAQFVCGEWFGDVVVGVGFEVDYFV